VEDFSKKFLLAMKRLWLNDPGDDKAIALIGHTVSAFSIRIVGILYQRRPAGHERVLPIIDRVSVSVGNAKIDSTRHLPAEGKSSAVVNAGSSALEDINGAKLRNRPRQRIDARRKWAGERWRHLPGRKRLNVIVGAEKIGSSAVVDGILDVDRWRQIRVD